VGLAESLFRSTCIIRTPAEGKAGGVLSYSYTSGVTIASGVPCEVQADSSRDGLEFGREHGRTRYTGWFRATQSIGLRSRITWTPRGSSTAKTLEVVSPPRDPSGIGDHVEVTLEERT
jgi:hypothetical protein